MRVEIGNNDGFADEVVARVKNILESAAAPKVSRVGTEYAAVISFGSVCIFRVNIGQEVQLVKGSMVRQTDAGSLKIGFLNIFDTDIVGSLFSLVQEHWKRIRDDADSECAVVYSPVQKIANF